MKFPYRKVPMIPSKAFPKKKSHLRPVIPISLKTELGGVRYEALIDSGADYNIFPSELGEMIGLKVKDGFNNPIKGVTGNSVDVYFQK